MLRYFLKISELGVCPIARKETVNFYFNSLLFRFSFFLQAQHLPPLFHQKDQQSGVPSISIFGVFITLSCIAFDAQNISSDYQINFIAYSCQVSSFFSSCISSPNNGNIFFLYKKPSHVAQAEMPIPEYFFSASSPRYLAVAPVAIITVSASTILFSSKVTLCFKPEKSASVAIPIRISVPIFLPVS